ncbi:MAG: zinc ribbon domain-containing protein [Desulfitobacterium sp.]|nr:zinc ribbon domain-containing protein [Desulfitobacterium sp.]
MMNSKEFDCNSCNSETFDCSQSGCGGGFYVDEESLKKFPEFAMVCNSCKHEFKLETSMSDVENEVCPSCQSSDLKNLYVSFPEDGPGFKDPKTFNGFSFGGCD